MSSIEDSVKEILIQDLFIAGPKETLSITDSLRGHFGVDSIGFVELRSRIEKQFGIVIAEADFTPENFANIATVTGLINRYHAR
jgi:acyl carrier protein